MKYQSKKDPTIVAHLENEDAKYGTVLMSYTSGPSIGKTFSITKSTLKRWWKLIEEEKSAEEILNIDFEKVNTTYPEPKTQKYIPKPKSVIEYEAKKSRAVSAADLPDQDAMCKVFEGKLAKINKTYIVLQNGCWLERKAGYTNLYATEEVWEAVTNAGFTSRANGMKNTKLKYVIKFSTNEEFEKISEILLAL